MSTRVGVELTGTRCSLVSLDCAEGEQSRVLAFRTIEYSPDDTAELTAELQRIAAAGAFPPRVNVVLGGLRSVHRVIPVPSAPRAKAFAYAIAEAHRILPDFRLWADEAWIGCAEVDGSNGRGASEVLFAAVAGADVRARLQPLVAAGFTVDDVATPALALTGIARWRRWEGSAVTAYLAMNRVGGSLLITEGSRVLLTRELPWEYQQEHPSDHGRLLDRYVFAGRVARQLQEAFAEVLRYGRVVSQVVTCGDMTGLRSMTMPLIAALDLEVETLDSMAGIDVAALPEPASQFGEQVAALRMAWAMAAWPPALRLRPHAHPVPLVQRTARLAAAAAAAAAAVFAGMFLTDSRTPGAVAPAMRDPIVASGATASGSLAPPAESRDLLATLGSSPAPQSRAPVASAGGPSAEARSATSAAPETIDWEPSTSGAVDGAVRTSIDRPREDAPVPTLRRAGEPVAAVDSQAADPVVRSILFSADRRLAVIDDQILSVGDTLGSATVADITRDGVVLRLASGKEKRLAMRSPLSGGFRR